MKLSRITSRYAKSLLMMSVERNILEDVHSDMNLMQRICKENKDFRSLLQSPIIKTDKKNNIINKILSDSVSEITMAFISIVTNKKRESYLEGISESFSEQYRDYKNIENVTVTTAVEMDSDIKQEVLAFIKKKTDKTVELKESVDSKIIGGAIIKIGDKQIDASVLKEINKLKHKFKQNLYIKDF